MAMFRPPRNLSMGLLSPPARFPRAARWVLIMMAAVLCSATSGGAQEKASAPAPSAPDNKPAQYVGSDTCQACHEDIFNAFQKNPHHAVEADKKRGFDGKACESCHGPGSKHAESMVAADIRQPAKLRPAEADKICLVCHLNQPTHVGRINASHAKNQVACVACHSIHKNGPNGLVARKAADINQLCAKCHMDVWASFQCRQDDHVLIVAAGGKEDIVLRVHSKSSAAPAFARNVVPANHLHRVRVDDRDGGLVFDVHINLAVPVGCVLLGRAADVDSAENRSIFVVKDSNIWLRVAKNVEVVIVSVVEIAVWVTLHVDLLQNRKGL